MKYDAETVKQWAGDSQWRALRAEFARYGDNGYSRWSAPCFWALVIYRLQRGCPWAPLRIVKKLFTLATLIDIHPNARIGPGFLIVHGGPLCIDADATFGADCSILHGCTIGAMHEKTGATIGDHVSIGCHATILGRVKIGDGALIAANTLVLHDVPAGCTAIGVPAKNLPRMPYN
jgi:serine O-acetyltransferase